MPTSKLFPAPTAPVYFAAPDATKLWLALLLLLLGSAAGMPAIAQDQGEIRGRVLNAINNEPVPFANVILQGTGLGAPADADGNYRISGLKPGEYNIEASAIGFKKQVAPEVRVQNFRATMLDLRLEEDAGTLVEVEVVQKAQPQPPETPLSLRSIGIAEVQRNPGGNRDVSNALQSLPGVSTNVSFRNDIIIRGGSPNENRFYLDGIEVPNINHFATQGASGGPVGLINVNFIRQVDLYTGAFPANRGNALSSVLEFRQKNPNDEKLALTGMVSSTDVGLTLDGPVTENSGFIFSVRRSYLQLLFRALGLPFLPTYNDSQFKYRTRIGRKDQLTFIGLGAIDNLRLNLDANETEEQRYILGNIPQNRQWSYTVGGKYEHFRTNSFQTLVISRSQLYNQASKYLGDSENNPLLLKYESEETENKVRLENDLTSGLWKLNTGLSLEQAIYTNSTFNRIVTPVGVLAVDYAGRLELIKYGAFGQLSRELLANRLRLSLGLRADGADYNRFTRNPLRQLSPRFSASYTLLPCWSLNFNTGIFYQLPAYTVLGYRDNSGTLVNRNNGTRHIQARHLVAGVRYETERNGQLSVEGFHKGYRNYPFLLRDSISLANLGGDFGVVGDEPVMPTSRGRAYGIEFLAQQRLLKGYYGIAAYTFLRSEFQDRNGAYRPSSWDNRHIVSLTAGKQFARNWEAGFRFRYTSGTPYTPYDVALSSQIEVWNTEPRGQLDYTRLNTLRNPYFYQIDFRIDKKYYFRKWSLNFYLDIQNLTNYKYSERPNLTVVTGADGQPLTDPNDPTRYQTKFLKNTGGTILPSLGLMVEF